MKFSVAPALGLTLFVLPIFAEEQDSGSLEFTKWTPGFQVPDPVAISFDDQGRAYVTQTQRRKANDLDIRENRDWIPDDLSFRAPDDKRAFYLKNFTPENSEANKARVADYNKDGIHDIADLQMLTERIHLIEDTDGDGLADQTSVYAEGFNDPIAGIAAGVLHHDGDVYTTIVPDVWKLRDTDGDGKADTRESIAYGFGVHLAYAGHDMHGLTVGPDGRIYWTIGDKGVGITSKEGLHFNYPNHGALLRCDPDGSNFEVYARGLRNVQEIAFDQYGNIFGVDNDSDRPGEKERFVYIVQHMDAGWRSNWQYRNGVFNPWMDENLSVPYHEGQPAHITPAISLFENGPAGMAFNPGTALNPKWKDYFFHTSAPNGQQWAFQVEQNGASYRMINDRKIGNGVPIVGISFGPDGALYGVDWGGGYPLNEKGAVWKWDVAKKDPRRASTAEELRSDFSTYSSDQLVKSLEHPDQRVRLKAQFELVKRGVKDDLEIAAKNSTRLGRIHAIWGLGQLMRKSDSPDFNFVLELLKDPDSEIKTQALKAIGDQFGIQLALHRAPAPSQEISPLVRSLTPLLKDPSDRVKFQAAITLGNIGSSSAAADLHVFSQSIGPKQTYLRHAAIVGLTGCASSEFLAALADDESELVQKVAVVALRRRADPAVAIYLKSPFENVAVEAARAIHDDWTIPAALPALASSLATTPWLKNESIIRRAINANFHLGTSAHAERVASFSTHSGVPEVLRLEALDALSHWTQPELLDRVVGRYRPLEKRDPAIAKEAAVTQLATLLSDEDPKIQSRTMRLALSLEITIPADSLIAVLQNEAMIPELRIEAMRGLANQERPDLDQLLTQSLGARESEIRIEALGLLAASNPTEALKVVAPLLWGDAPLNEKQAAVSLLATSLASKEGDQLLKESLSSFAQVPAGLRLDLAEAAVARKLEGPAPDFAHTLEGGDAERGQDLFMNHLAAQCIRCHMVSRGKGSDIGPNLREVGKKDRKHLMESIVEPQKVVADGYGAISLTLKSGKSVTGTFLREKSGTIEIRDAEGRITKVKSDDVQERSPLISTMPPMGFILTKREIRDLVEYLSSLRGKN
ncbi:MAG: PVC-type heme-binding CxxCH protein [Verrucomicrobiaceae bacterium]